MFEDDDPKPGSTESGTEEVVDDPVQPEDAEAQDEADEELYDPKTGKPLPWAQSKRFRKIYREAKTARELNTVLDEAGLTPNDLRGALGELTQFRQAYQEWKAAKAQGDTTPADDKEAAELKSREAAISKRLKELGFVTKEDFDAQRAAENQHASAQQVASEGREHLASLLQAEGLLSESMDEDEIDEVMTEWDAKVGRRIMKNKADIRAFQSGDKKVIVRHFKEALASSRKRGSSPPPNGRAKINDLPKRLGTGPSPSSRGGKKEEEPTSIREAARQMLEEMSGR